jgi:hypothetical protein
MVPPISKNTAFITMRILQNETALIYPLKSRAPGGLHLCFGCGINRGLILRAAIKLARLIGFLPQLLRNQIAAIKSPVALS